jgi:2-dehydro-3-deoxyphosphogluconate aldolase/(4S)-4-hydroxy-2-oxoglutarate aldolase
VTSDIHLREGRLSFLEHIRKTRLIPVANVVSARDAVPLAHALVDAGLPCVEITFRTAAAADAIEAIATDVPELFIGAGTVRTIEQVDRAVEAGARFLVAPGLNAEVVSHSAALGVPMLPGVCTPTEVDQAVGMGLTLLKFFPAEAAGGVAYLSALAGPYADVLFVPTGGIGLANLPAYLGQPTVVACGGSWMVKSSLIVSNDFATITRLTAEALTVAGTANRVPG